MGAGMYTAPERVVRDGYLVCFEGERMTMAEAERRGLVDPAPAEPDVPQEPDAQPAQGEADRAAELVATMKAVELRAMAEDLGVDVPNGASKPVIAQAIAAAEAAGA